MTAIMLNSEAEIGIEVPDGIASLRSFRRWALSPEFPDSCRIDFVQGRIEIDMSPEEIFSHGTPKVEILRVIANRLLENDFGMVLGDSTRVSSIEAGLSAEPDVVFVSHRRIQSGQVKITPAKKQRRNSGVELVGGVDMVAEILSRGSIKKDTLKLPKAYFDAGVTEFWLVDALGEDFRFQVYGRGRTGFVARRADAEGGMNSTVFGCRVKMTRSQSAHGYDRYRLEFQSKTESDSIKRKK